MDGPACHTCPVAARILEEAGIDLLFLLPFTTAECQLSDDPLLNGCFAIERRRLMQYSMNFNQNLDLTTEFGLIQSLLDQTFIPMNIWKSAIRRGYSFRHEGQFNEVTITEDDARAWVQRLSNEGKFDYHLQKNLEQTATLRCDAIIAVKELVTSGILPPTTNILTSPASLLAMSQQAMLFGARHVSLKCESRKLDRQVRFPEINLIENPDAGCQVVNDAARIEAGKQYLLSKKASSLAAESRRINREKKRKKMLDAVDEESLRMIALKDAVLKIKEMTDNEYESLLISKKSTIARYRTGNNITKFPLEHGVKCMLSNKPSRNEQITSCIV
jgi:hypothetical protein